MATGKLGKYELFEKLGEGATAEVYRASDTVLGREVALKILRSALIADREAYARFVQEARAASGLFHPQIATVLDLGEAEGRYFIAMRYVEGPPLDRVIAKTGALAWKTAFRITGEVGAALQFAHAKGLVHRDVKPQNIILSESEGAVLTDFGLAKALNSSGITTTGGILGTLAYIPPEIWKGEDAVPASDQYALACVLVEMLTGKVLFAGRTPPAVMAKHFEPPDLPATWPSGVPAGAGDLLRQALGREPKERHADLAVFIESLHGAERSPSARAVPPSASHSPDASANPAGIEWVEIPAGEFLYGDKKEKQYIRKPYLIGKYPVTNAQYRRFLEANPAHPVPNVNANWARPYNWDEKKRTPPPGKENHPVVNVSWQDAQAFCQWAGCRLPTETEWEKAARGTDGRRYPWGEEWVAGKYCNSQESRISGTTAVDEYPEGASPYGALDMSGNVWEWTASQHEGGGYVLRGGSWYLDENGVRSANRGRDDPSGTNSHIGFRCSRSVP